MLGLRANSHGSLVGFMSCIFSSAISLTAHPQSRLFMVQWTSWALLREWGGTSPLGFHSLFQTWAFFPNWWAGPSTSNHRVILGLTISAHIARLGQFEQWYFNECVMPTIHLVIYMILFIAVTWHRDQVVYTRDPHFLFNNIYVHTHIHSSKAILLQYTRNWIDLNVLGVKYLIIITIILRIKPCLLLLNEADQVSLKYM